MVEMLVPCSTINLVNYALTSVNNCLLSSHNKDHNSANMSPLEDVMMCFMCGQQENQNSSFS